MTANRTDGRRKRPRLESAWAEKAELPFPGSNEGENSSIGNIAHVTPSAPSCFRCSVQPLKNTSKDDSPNVSVSIPLFVY